MALKLNLKKDELIWVAVEMGLEIPSKAKIIDLKKLIESSAVYKNDIEFVRSLVENALEKSKQEAEKNEREAEIQLEKIKLSQIEKQLELEKEKIVNNLLTYVSQEDLSNYVKIKELILRDIEPTTQECLSNFKNARKLPSENYDQFASRLSATFDYYCQLRKANEFRSLCDLIISDKIFETLDRDTMNHIATKQGETYFKPQQLGRECDVYLSARGKVSNDLMSRNPGSGVKTDGRYRLHLAAREKLVESFRGRNQKNCVLCHLERVVESSEPPTHYYIPHHGVLRPEKLTTKLRIVFNGSSPTTKGISLNYILFKGEVKEDVFETISRFRRHKFAFTTDIQKMYRQILINPDQQDLLMYRQILINPDQQDLLMYRQILINPDQQDLLMYRQILINRDQQDLQRIIWKHGLDAEILTYRLKTVTYGLSNAPFLAIKTLQQLANDEKSRFPLASETLSYDTYMNDIVSGAPDLETAQQLQSQLKDALQSCGMNLHKWSSNSPELLNSSLSSDVEHSFSIDIDLSVKTLGISWKPFEDCFVFKVSVSAKHIYTKREVLSVIAKLYNPLGFLGPVIAKAKVFLQQLWQCKLDWDDVLPNSIANEWR
ncbi:integrase catalytic domain-containing protein [Trichonephila clavipes]|uniref:Integrase catalytic domain-containing protein n=1 Tax=Trichonephila clavipes TaxID=2585209 RepID=A0A8X6RIG6_TRICX|nr:integrase catalytic domain-containing protein [Trichonephila clavipes]